MRRCTACSGQSSRAPIGAKRGRTIEQLATISGALTLLANVIMAWNTHRMQAIVGGSPDSNPDELIARIAPTTHQHINMRGILTFNLGRHRPRLLGPIRLPSREKYQYLHSELLLVEPHPGGTPVPLTTMSSTYP